MESGLTLTVDDGVARLKLTRPGSRNALTHSLCVGLRAALLDITRLPGCGILVIEGSGGAFASGADIQELDRLRERPEELKAFYRELRAAQEFLYALDCITIAAIDGYCIGAGLSLALACDFRIATPTSVFAAPPAKLGLIYSPIEVARLALHVGSARARDLLFTGRRVPAEESLRLGLIGRMVTTDGLQPAVNELIVQLRSCSPAALRKTKAQLLTVERAGIDATAGESQAEEAFFEPDAAEGMRAFLERRPPRFRS